MKKKEFSRSAILLATLAIAFIGCGSRENTLAEQAEQYEVVGEGSASGVTSTIHSPGEIPPPVTASDMTGTSLDTTTAFAILDPLVGAPGQPGAPGTLAQTLPVPGAPQSPAPVQYPAQPRPAQPAPRIDIQRSVPPPPPQPVQPSEPALPEEDAPEASGEEDDPPAEPVEEQTEEPTPEEYEEPESDDPGTPGR